VNADISTKCATITIAVVPFNSKGGRLNPTSRPSPTETDGTALGMKKSRSMSRLGAGRMSRRASAAQLPDISAAALAMSPVKTLPRS